MSGPRRRMARKDMPLVARVLEMLLAAFPSLEFDIEIQGSPPEPERPWREAERPRPERPQPERPQPASHAPDPVLARCYAELGIPYGTDFRQVRRAWRGLMRTHHPDVQGEDAERQRIGTEKVKRFNRAFEEIGKRLRGGKGGKGNA
jgi:DnaJ-domain-containing protein 1